MAEKIFEIVIHQNQLIDDEIAFNFPIRFTFARDVEEVQQRIRLPSKNSMRAPKLFFIVWSNDSTIDKQLCCSQFEINPQVLSVFIVVNEKLCRKNSIGKIRYVPRSLLTIVVSLTAIHYLRQEIIAETALARTDLIEIYSKNVDIIRNWLIANIRATPPHILVIPLNTSRSNLENAIVSLEKSCAELGYTSTSIRILKDYIPQTEIYDKLPYGKQYFEHEIPQTIVQLLKELCPVRLYLYGNEPTIESEWSKAMIAEEVDLSNNRIIDDDDWYAFLEHEPVTDEIKWNFALTYGRSWKTRHFQPIKSASLTENIIFRSALRRTHATFDTRRAKITARLLVWYEENRTHKYLFDECEPKTVKLSNPMEQIEILLNPDYERPKAQNVALNGKEVATQHYSLVKWNPYPLKFVIKTGPIYIWLGENFSIDYQFINIISPNSWNHFTNVFSCEKFIQNYYSDVKNEIILVLSTTLAREFFTTSKSSHTIKTIYLYLQKHEWSLEYVDQYPKIHGIYPSLNSLFDQFQLGLQSNTSSPPFTSDKDKSFLPFSFVKDENEISKGYQNIIRSLSEIAEKPTNDEFEKALRALSLDDKILPQEKQAFIESYQPHEAIHWYTRNGFLYRSLNQTLASQDLNSIYLFRYFISDLMRCLKECSEEYHNDYNEKILTVYRGQTLSADELNEYNRNIGECVVLRSFLSTTASLSVASMFAGVDSSSETTSTVRIIFSFEIDLTERYTSSFASIAAVSVFPEEEEYLFNIGSIFRINSVGKLSPYSDINVIHLRMVEQLKTEEFFSEIIDEKLQYHIGVYQDQFDRIERFDGLKNVFQQSNISFFDVRKINEIKNLENDDESKVNIVLPHHVGLSNKIFKRFNEIRYEPMNTHPHDFVYLVASEMLEKMRFANAKKLHKDFMNFYKISPKQEFYVQLLHTLNYRYSENRFKDQFPSSPVVCFYQVESSSTFFQMINQEDSSTRIILLLQSDDPQIDDVIEKFEKFYCIKNIRLCSACGSNVKDRRIIEDLCSDEDEFYRVLTDDHAKNTRCRAREQIEIHKNPNEALRLLEESKNYQQLLTEENQ